MWCASKLPDRLVDASSVYENEGMDRGWGEAISTVYQSNREDRKRHQSVGAGGL